MTATELTAALRDYLTAIYEIERVKRVARPRDIAAALGVHKSTVTAALHALAERGMIHYAPYEVVTLTAAGKRRARQLADRCEVLRHFLADVLGLDAESAAENARRMMHALDEEALGRIACFVAFAHECARAEGDWPEEFRRVVEQSQGVSCDAQIARFLSSVGARRGRSARKDAES